MNLVQLTKNGSGYQLPDGRVIPDTALRECFSCKLDYRGSLTRLKIYLQIREHALSLGDRANSFHLEIKGKAHLLNGFYCSMADLPKPKFGDYKF